MSHRNIPGENETTRLFADFMPPTLAEWRSEVERLLRGKSFDKVMPTRTCEEITVRPIYTAADAASTDTAPGEKPFRRGTSALGYREQPWLVAQEIACADPAELNALLRHDLARGQTAVNLLIGPDGTRIESGADLDLALKDIDLGTMPLLLTAGRQTRQAVTWLAELATARGVATADLRGATPIDPLADLAGSGATPLDELYDDLAELCRWTTDKAPGLRCVAACGIPWHEAGGSAVDEVGLTMASAVEHLRRLESRGVDPALAAGRMQFYFAVGTDFFTEIAKLRAARQLWCRIAESCGADDEACRLRLHVRTSRRVMSRLDPHTNLLRTTTAALAAILGGCDSLHVAPFDEPLGPPSEVARRCARNIQIILQQESHLDQVVDPAGGCWYVESLTDEMADRSWQRFQEIENAGGMASALVDGLPQRLIAETATRRGDDLATRRTVVVGANLYPAPQAAPANITPEATPPRQDDAVVVEAPALTMRRDAEVFEELRAAIDGHEAARVFVATLGSVAAYMPRLDFARSFFQIGGFEVFGGADGDGPAAAGESGCGVIVIVSTDERYATEAEATATALKALSPAPLVVLAGHPGEHREKWRAAGVDRFIHLRSDLPAVLTEVAKELGVLS